MIDDDSSDNREGSKTYEVGYGRPPKEHRFKKGRSGNPKGRPKKKTNETFKLKDILMQPRDVRIKGRVQKMSGAEVLFRNLLEKAMQGQPASVKLVVQIIEKAGLLNKESFAPAFNVEGARERLAKKFEIFLNNAKVDEREKYAGRPIGDCRDGHECAVSNIDPSVTEDAERD